ncbi:MAG: hypothetical protein IPG34_19520 [Rhodocyclaceae bacterium]|nr:hypothetical protein [Rhodocyclaceae bacterium]
MLSNHEAAKMHAEGQLRLAHQIDLASTPAGGFRGQLDKMATSAQPVGGKLDTAYKLADAFEKFAGLDRGYAEDRQETAPTRGEQPHIFSTRNEASTHPGTQPSRPLAQSRPP